MVVAMSREMSCFVLFCWYAPFVHRVSEFKEGNLLIEMP